MSPLVSQLEEYDKNRDGQLSPDEYGNNAYLVGIGRFGGNNNGIVAQEKWEARQRLSMAPSSLLSIRLQPGATTAGDGQSLTKELWRYEKSFVGVVPSPLLYDGVLYLVKNGRAERRNPCIDKQTRSVIDFFHPTKVCALERKQPMHRALILVALPCLAFTPALAQDPAKVAAKQCKVAFENEYVRVLHWTVSAHEKTPMHEHPALVTVSLSAGKARFTSPDGKTREVESKAGQAIWSDPEKHSSEDLGGKPGEVIQVELKKKPAAAMTTIPASEDSVKVDPKHYKVEFQNDRVRVLRIKYRPKEKSVMHSHPASVAVFLTDGQSKFTLADGKTNEATFKAGEAQWADKDKHLPENLAVKTLELILVEFK
jgi:quercetin dioxygenase-like cupin family protein